MPGFMKIDYSDQIRKEQKIGGGGCAAIYKGVILDNSLKEVSFFLFLSLSFSFFLFLFISFSFLFFSFFFVWKIK